AQFRFDPILGIEEDLTVCLPDAIAMHPCVPPSRLRFFEQERFRLLIPLKQQRHTLNEELHRADGLLDARGQLAGTHLYVAQVAVEQFVAVKLIAPPEI